MRPGILTLALHDEVGGAPAAVARGVEAASAASASPSSSLAKRFAAASP
jgi:hypothetical protein